MRVRVCVRVRVHVRRRVCKGVCVRQTRCECLGVEFLLKTDGGYPRDAGVFFH